MMKRWFDQSGGRFRDAARISAVLALTLALAAGLCQFVPAAVNVNAPCTVTVVPGGDEYAGDLADADVVVDLYKVADAAREAGLEI